MSIILKTPSNGSVTLAEQDTASDVVVTVPAINGSFVTANSSGNVGLGVTPSAWAAGSKGMEFAAAGNAVWSNGASLMHVLSNSYFNGTNYIYGATAPAAHYYQFNGTHVWRNAPSGTAGNAISFTQAMTLDADGELGIGIVAPNEKLHVSGAGKFTGQANSLDQAGAIIDYASSIARITGTGASGGTLAFFTNPNGGFQAERMRIDSSGNLLVGTTTPFGRFVANGGGSSAITARFSGANGAAVGYNCIYDNGAGTAYAAAFYYSGTSILSGTITYNSVGTAYNTTSDYRLKENVAPMTGALEKVAALKPVTYTWKSDGSAGQGFIAHELQAVVPDCVSGTKDAVDAEGNPQYQGIDVSFLVATLTAAIQEQQAIIIEQQAIITQLQADVAALQGAA